MKFKILREDAPEYQLQCPQCKKEFFCSPFTEEGCRQVFGIQKNPVLITECPHCHFIEQEYMQDLSPQMILGENERQMSALRKYTTLSVDEILSDYMPYEAPGMRHITEIGHARIIAELHSLRARVEELEKAIDDL